jgi:hypothetical protein
MGLGFGLPYDWLVGLRCTKKLLDLLRLDPVPAIAPCDEDWYANVLLLDRRKCLLLTHAGTLFSIFEPDVRVADLRLTREFVTALIARELREEGCPSGTFGDLGSQALVIAKTADRSVLGCMNDMAFFCEVAVGESGGLARLDDRALNRRLRRNINSARNYQRPIDLVRMRLAE